MRNWEEIKESKRHNIYEGLEISYSTIGTWTGQQKDFWHEKPGDYVDKWQIRMIDENGSLWHTASSVCPIENRPNLGKFKHILKTDNPYYEFRIFEKGILKVLTESGKRKIQEEANKEAGYFIDRNGNKMKCKYEIKFL
jgi:hypothetical protein